MEPGSVSAAGSAGAARKGLRGRLGGAGPCRESPCRESLRPGSDRAGPGGTRPTAEAVSGFYARLFWAGSGENRRIRGKSAIRRRTGRCCGQLDRSPLAARNGELARRQEFREHFGRARGPVAAPAAEARIAYNAGMPPVGSLREQASEALGGARPRALYDQDSWAWARQQAAALRRRDYSAVDWDNLIEEVDDLAGRQEDAWTSCCANVLSHMLKIRHSGAREACGDWVKEISTWRLGMYAKHIDNPGMRSKFPELLANAWHLGRKTALSALSYEGGHSHRVQKQILRSLAARIPEECPYGLEDVIGYDPQQRRKRLRKIAPDRAVWPADVAETLNEELGEDYPVRPASRSRARDGGYRR